MITVLFLLFASAAFIFSFSSVALRESRSARVDLNAKQSYFLSEAGVEDLIYRIVKGKQYLPSQEVVLDGLSSSVSVTTDSSTRTVESSGDKAASIRKTKVAVNITTANIQFFYGVQVSDGGLSMGNNATVNGNIYSNGSIIGNNGARVTGDAVVAGGINPNPSVEWASHNTDQTFATVAGNRDIAQSFIADASAKLNRAAVYIAKVGSPASDLTLRITNDNGGKPNNSDIASAVIARATVGATPSWINVSFASPPDVIAGNKYWIVLDYGADSALNHWNWRKDSTDGYAGNTGRSTSNWSSGGAVWTDVGGDLAFQVWIGGINTKIDNMIVGDDMSGAAQANLFVNATVHGSSCPNAYCIISNPPREELPISDGVIQDWREAGEAGGTCVPPQCDLAGTFKLTNGATASLGPKKITGNLELDNNAVLTVTGTIWVLGEIKLSNNCAVNLDPLYGSNSGVILTDSKVTISNNCAFQGSGAPGSYTMLLSAKDSPAEEVITVDNNSAGVIYYASRGIIKFSNNATAKEATGYGMRLDNNAVITYESGLADAFFSSGPGAGWQIQSWNEVK